MISSTFVVQFVESTQNRHRLLWLLIIICHHSWSGCLSLNRQNEIWGTDSIIFNSGWTILIHVISPNVYSHRLKANAIVKASLHGNSFCTQVQEKFASVWPESLVSIYLSHFAYACKMRYPLNLVLENSEYLWFYWTFCIVILDYGLKLHKLSNHTLVMLQKWLEIH